LIEQQARSEVTTQTTRNELFQILSDAIAPLQNGHVGIVDNGKTVSFKRADKPTIYDRLRAEFLTENQLTLPLTELQKMAMAEYSATNLELIQAASANYLDTSQIKYAANENIIWGKFKSGNYGYLNVLGFSEFTDSTEDYGNMLETMHQAMQQILTDLENTDALVIDLRFNGGGYPFLARALSQYFVSQMQLGYIKSVRYGNYFSPEQFIYISPKAPYYDKPIVVLVSNTTASSAEMATLILAERPNVTLIGESTQGMQSGKQLRVLPNGFIFSLSNIRLLSANREYYEQRGIPADIEATFASKADRTEGKDSGLKAALKWLSQND
jgi:C-terminal processing protease CtpA/Prc